MATANLTALRNFKHRVELTTSYTASVNDVDIVLVREKRKTVLASITPVRGEFYLNGIAQQENRNAYSHYIIIRFNRDMDITGYAWIYEERPSGNRWYKVISVEELGEKQRYWQICCRLVQKAEDADVPSEKHISEYDKLPVGAVL